MANRERTKKKEGAAFPESGADSQAAISVSGADCTDTKAAISVSGADCTDTKAAISVAGADCCKNTTTTTAIGYFSRWCGRGINLVGECLVFWCIIARLYSLLFGYIKHQLKNIVD